MRSRLALLLVLLSAGIHWGVTRPAQETIARAVDEQRRLREEGRALSQRLLPLERREAAHSRALQALQVPPLPEGREVQVLRRAVLGTLKGERLEGARVAVRPGRGDLAASVSLACEGELEPVLRAASELARPGSGLVLARVRLDPAATGVVLALEANGIRGRN